MWNHYLFGVTSSTDSLIVALIGLAGASLGAIALIYNARRRTDPSAPTAMTAPNPPPTDLSMVAFQTYDQFREISRRMDRNDDRVERLEHQVDYNTRRLDRGITRPYSRPTEPEDDDANG